MADNDTGHAAAHALKAADEIAAALQAHLVQQHGARLDDPGSPAADSLNLLKHARERLGRGLRVIERGSPDRLP